MCDVEAETVLLLQTPGQRSQFRHVELLHRLAGAAHQVDVLILAGPVIGQRTVRKVHVRDQVELLKQFQRPVDGRDIDPGRDRDDLRVHLLGRGMTHPADRLQHELPLRCQPQTALTQNVG